MNSISFVYPLFLLKNNIIKPIEQKPKIANKFAKDLKISIEFLEKYTYSSETIRSYVKEIERLLIWCIYLGNINIVNLQSQHIATYQKFLTRPKPKNIWCGSAVPKQTRNKEINTKWRLFVDDLSNSSIIKTFKILKLFFSYLVNHKHLVNNPMLHQYNLIKPKIIVEHKYLELSEIQAILTGVSKFQAQHKSHEFKAIRAKYIILLFYYTGLTVSEVSNNTMGSFIKRQKNWFLHITDTSRLIPIHPALLKALMQFKLNISTADQPKCKDQIPLIPSKNLKSSINAKRINQIVKWAFNLGALYFEPNNLKTSFKLRKATVRSLRNSYIKFNLNNK